MAFAVWGAPLKKKTKKKARAASAPMTALELQRMRGTLTRNVAKAVHQAVESNLAIHTKNLQALVGILYSGLDNEARVREVEGLNKSQADLIRRLAKGGVITWEIAGSVGVEP